MVLNENMKKEIENLYKTRVVCYSDEVTRTIIDDQNETKYNKIEFNNDFRIVFYKHKELVGILDNISILLSTDENDRRFTICDKFTNPILSIDISNDFISISKNGKLGLNIISIEKFDNNILNIVKGANESEMYPLFDYSINNGLLTYFIYPYPGDPSEVLLEKEYNDETELVKYFLYYNDKINQYKKELGKVYNKNSKSEYLIASTSFMGIIDCDKKFKLINTSELSNENTIDRGKFDIDFVLDYGPFTIVEKPDLIYWNGDLITTTDYSLISDNSYVTIIKDLFNFANIERDTINISLHDSENNKEIIKNNILIMDTIVDNVTTKLENKSIFINDNGSMASTVLMEEYISKIKQSILDTIN